MLSWSIFFCLLCLSQQYSPVLIAATLGNKSGGGWWLSWLTWWARLVHAPSCMPAHQVGDQGAKHPYLTTTPAHLPLVYRFGPGFYAWHSILRTTTNANGWVDPTSRFKAYSQSTASDPRKRGPPNCFVRASFATARNQPLRSL